jgi:hypothetical protein
MDDSWIYTLNSDMMRKEKEKLKGQGIVISNLASQCQNKNWQREGISENFRIHEQHRNLSLLC